MLDSGDRISGSLVKGAQSPAVPQGPCAAPSPPLWCPQPQHDPPAAPPHDTYARPASSRPTKVVRGPRRDSDRVGPLRSIQSAKLIESNRLERPPEAIASRQRPPLPGARGEAMTLPTPRLKTRFVERQRHSVSSRRLSRGGRRPARARREASRQLSCLLSSSILDPRSNRSAERVSCRASQSVKVKGEEEGSPRGSIDFVNHPSRRPRHFSRRHDSSHSGHGSHLEDSAE